MKQMSHTATLYGPEFDCSARDEMCRTGHLFIDFEEGGPLVRIDGPCYGVRFVLEENVLRLQDIVTPALLILRPAPGLSELDAMRRVEVETIKPTNPAVETPPFFLPVTEKRDAGYFLHRSGEGIYKYAENGYDDDRFFASAVNENELFPSCGILLNVITGVRAPVPDQRLIDAWEAEEFQPLLPVSVPEDRFDEEVLP